MLILSEVQVFAEHAREQAAAGSEVTRAMIARSGKRIEQSRNILSEIPPKIWHPKPK